MPAFSTPSFLDALLPGAGAATDAETSTEGIWDDRLAALAAGGDSESFRALVCRHESALHGFCFHLLGCSEDARDAAQEIFVRTWHALPHYVPRRQFRAWLWRIALNLCCDRLRSRKRRSPVVPWSVHFDESLIAPGLDPGEAAQWRSEWEKLSRAICGMPESLRWPLTLCAIEGLSQAECASVLNLSIRSVEGRIHRARAWLHEWWSRHS